MPTITQTTTPLEHIGGVGFVASRHHVPAELLKTTTTAICGIPYRCMLLCTKANDTVDVLDGVWGRLLTESLFSALLSSLESVIGGGGGDCLVVNLQPCRDDNALQWAKHDMMYDCFGSSDCRGGGGGRWTAYGIHLVLRPTCGGVEVFITYFHLWNMTHCYAIKS
jgi:hypothetical protein